MIQTILLTAFFVFIFGAMYAVSSVLVGRGDKAHGCGTGDCARCGMNPDSCDEEPVPGTRTSKD